MFIILSRPPNSNLSKSPFQKTRDIGAYQQQNGNNGAQQQSGYGNDVPKQPLPVSLQQTTVKPNGNGNGNGNGYGNGNGNGNGNGYGNGNGNGNGNNGNGYPRENPPNPLKVPVVAEPTNNLEIRTEAPVQTTTMSGLMMMMNAIPGTPGDDYP